MDPENAESQTKPSVWDGQALLSGRAADNSRIKLDSGLGGIIVGTPSTGWIVSLAETKFARGLIDLKL